MAPRIPATEDGYLNHTYDLSDYCDVCGIGARQKASFQMKGEPKWGKKSVLQLNWVFDEFFVTPALWKSVFRSAGIECLPVLGKKGTELTAVVQLVVSDEVEVDLRGHTAERCGACGRVKYPPIARGFFPALTARLITPLTRTVQYVGSGASAFRPVIISRQIAQALSEHKAQGVSLRPGAPSAQRRPCLH